jgi:hypothetical protein
MTTLQVETKAFPTSIPNTISRDPVSPSSQFLSFYSASEGLRRAESISSPDESGGREGTGPASRRFEEEKLASLRGTSIIAAAVEALKLESKRVAATTRRSNAKLGRQNNFTRPISLEDVRRGYVDRNPYAVELSGTNPFRPRETPRSGRRQIIEDLKRQELRRPVREDSELSPEEIRREFPPPASGFVDHEPRRRRLLQPQWFEGDSSPDDDGPIIPRNRRPENRYPSYDPSGSPPASARQTSMGAPISARSATYADNAPVITRPPLTPGGSIGRAMPLRRPNYS